ncbi:hypothetical protein ABIB73_007505 [Bradyrhizobium sp. F1.4.3]|uniref:hypothetical protein n=1 Tax=Bradyrhizobium sp. F1.4.3 TaxID=3156356 RepID=UPI0033921E52
MSDYDGDREMLRLINAFKEIKNPGTRRAVVLLVEELAQRGDTPMKPPKNAG